MPTVIQQQEFLRDAAKAFDMTHKQLAALMYVSERALYKWLSSNHSVDFRRMPDAYWQLLRFTAYVRLPAYSRPSAEIYLGMHLKSVFISEIMEC